MINMFTKNSIQKIFNFFGYSVTKIILLTFDNIYKRFFNKEQELVIFDIGANKGQSIDRFLKLFPKASIHAFEPVKLEFLFLQKKFLKNKNIYLNNFAVGDVIEKKKFNVSVKTGVSSFYNFNKDTKWLRQRSKEYKINKNEFINNVEDVNVVTLDHYCKKNNINNIDVLKIDVQGYEEKVLAGSKEILGRNIIKIIESEIMFDDVYEKSLSFTDLEKYLLKNFKFSAIKLYNNNLFEGLNFFAEVMYIRKNLIKKNYNHD